MKENNTIMNKKMIAAFCLFLTLFFLVLPVMAQEENAYETDEFSEEIENSLIPEERQLPRLMDEADLLTDTEESSLLNKLDEISERQECDVILVTVNSLEGKTATAYADDFYDYNGYGYGEGDDGILLLISMEDRDWAISTYGFGIPAFTDAGQEYMVNKFKPYLSSGDYAEAFSKYAELCDQFITQAKTGKPYDIGNLPKGKVPKEMLPVDIFLAGIASFFVSRILIRKGKTVKRKVAANAYTVPGSLNITRRSDQQYNRTVVAHTIQKSSSTRSGGGSSTHRSSSGRSHGGSSGKF